MIKKPGVWDNKSYKDMYHFNDNFYLNNTIEDMPSLNVDPKINTTIKENPYRSNVEIEKDEIILQPDLSALFKAVGKKHSGGGIDVALRPDAFVFSDDKTLAFGEKDHKLFEFKKGGSFNPDMNTPAEVVKRNVDIKHYNTLVSNITDLKKDDLAKKSSTMMLEKYISTLGNIAFLQEAKKDFPQGIPPFSDGTAPVYDPEVKEKVMEQKQYAKYGGTINPYIMSAGGLGPCPCGTRDPVTGKCPPCDDATYQKIIPTARKVKKAIPGYDPIYTDPTGIQLLGMMGQDPKSFKVPGAIPGGPAGNPWKNKIQSMIDQGATVDDLVKQGHGYKAELLKMFKFRTSGTADDYIRIDPETGAPLPEGNPLPGNKPYSWEDAESADHQHKIKPGSPVGSRDMGRDIDWHFSPWQKVSQAYNLSKLATVKKYVPYRSHINPSYVDPALVNPEQAIGDMKGGFNQSMAGLRSLSPIIGKAQSSDLYGQFLNQVPGVRSQYDNQNVGIKNQFRQYNNQVRNTALSQNMQNDQDYYQQSVTANANFDNMKTFLGDQYMNNLMGDVQDNQSLAYTLAMIKDPAYSYNWRTTGWNRNQKNLLDVDNSMKDSYDDLRQQINNTPGMTPAEKIKALIELEKVKKFQTTAKYGGRIGRNPYK